MLKGMRREHACDRFPRYNFLAFFLSEYKKHLLRKHGSAWRADLGERR
jgi:hypothetical protein